MKEHFKESTSWKPFSKSGLMLLMLYLKWLLWNYQVQSRLKLTELHIYMKVQLMIQLDKPSKNVTKMVHSVFSSQRWFLQMIKVDSMLSEEFSQELFHQEWKLEFKDQTMFLENQMISKLKTFKELLSWWEVKSKQSQMYLAETLLLLLVLINIFWNKELLLLMKMLTTLESWNTQYLL